jgi:hypothetical protein
MVEGQAMMPGMAFELERQWHRDTADTMARDETQYRAAMEAPAAHRSAAHRSAAHRSAHPSRRERLVASLQSWAGVSTLAR